MLYHNCSAVALRWESSLGLHKHMGMSVFQIQLYQQEQAVYYILAKGHTDQGLLL